MQGPDGRGRVTKLEIGEAAGGERPYEVERERRVLVAAEEQARIGAARVGVELLAIHQVAEVAGERRAVARLGGARARLRVLPGEAPHAHHRSLHPVDQDQRHLEQDLELVGDVVRGAVGEALGAVSSLEEEHVPLGGLGELRLQLLDLPRGHQRRQAGEIPHHLLQARGVRIGGLLQRRPLLPGRRTPIHVHSGRRLYTRLL